VFDRREPSGAGSLPWYSGERFAAQGDVVFVSINYRLGALGFLCLPGISPGNLGLLDQIAALRFVRDNIAAFGGDPDNVTVVGQSAGAASIAIIMTMPQAGGLFRRAIMQSTPFGRISRTLEDAQRIGRCFAEILELQPEQGGALKSLPFARLLAAQAELGRLERKFADARAPFWAHYRRDGLCRRGYVRLKAGAGSAIDTMIGPLARRWQRSIPSTKKLPKPMRGQSKACLPRCSIRAIRRITTRSAGCARPAAMPLWSAT
jgi:para-nitrobenzyl esterase